MQMRLLMELLTDRAVCAIAFYSFMLIRPQVQSSTAEFKDIEPNLKCVANASEFGWRAKR